jgi:hypothetical protein
MDMDDNILSKTSKFFGIKRIKKKVEIEDCAILCEDYQNQPGESEFIVLGANFLFIPKDWYK